MMYLLSASCIWIIEGVSFAYEVFIVTATMLRVFTLVAHRRNAGTITSAFYEHGNI